MLYNYKTTYTLHVTTSFYPVTRIPWIPSFSIHVSTNITLYFYEDVSVRVFTKTLFPILLIETDSERAFRRNFYSGFSSHYFYFSSKTYFRLIPPSFPEGSLFSSHSFQRVLTLSETVFILYRSLNNVILVVDASLLSNFTTLV